MRWSGIARPTWMSGDVTSIPSLTRSGRPSFELLREPVLGQQVDGVARENRDGGVGAHGEPIVPALASTSGAPPAATPSTASPTTPASADSPPASQSVSRAPIAPTTRPPTASAPSSAAFRIPFQAANARPCRSGAIRAWMSAARRDVLQTVADARPRSTSRP